MCRSPIYYYGGKGKICNKIIKLIPAHTGFIEVCAGSAAVLLAKSPCEFEVLNDVSSEIVSLFKCLQDDKEREKLYQLIEYTPFSRELFEQWLAKEFTDEDPLYQRAYRTFLLANQSHNGKLHKIYLHDFRLCLNNKAILDFNRKIKVLDEVVERLKKVIIEKLDFEILIKRYDKGKDVVFYIDPPYPHNLRNRFTVKRYGKYEMSEEDHMRLINCVKNVRNKVMISGYSGDIYEELGWRKEIIYTRCAMNLKAKTSAREEVVFCNYEKEEIKEA